MPTNGDKLEPTSVALLLALSKGHLMNIFNCHMLFISGIILWAAMSQSLAQDAGTTLTPSQKYEVKTIVQEYIKNNPEIILEAIRVLREREGQAQPKQMKQHPIHNKEQLLNDPASPVAGNPNGNVTIVEFFDYLCQYCRQVFPDIQSLLKQDKNIKYIFKELPILSKNSEIAARVALVIWKNYREKHLEFHTKMMKSRSNLTERRILRIAKSVGAKIDLVKNQMYSSDINVSLRQNFKLAQRLGVSGTPGFIIGNRVIRGAIDITTMKRLVNDERNNR